VNTSSRQERRHRVWMKDDDDERSFAPIDREREKTRDASTRARSDDRTGAGELNLGVRRRRGHPARSSEKYSHTSYVPVLMGLSDPR
jgi:hypothetical protein